MKILEIISSEESLISLDHLSIDEIINILYKDCSEILKIYQKTKKIFYRGEKKDLFFFKSSYPRNRKPKDSPLLFHNFLNNSLKKSGFIATRENSVFVTPLLQAAKFYGNPYIFFPKNGFHYTWSEKIIDAYESYDKIARAINKNNIGVYTFNISLGFNVKYYKLKPNLSEEETLKKISKLLRRSFDNLGAFFNFCEDFYFGLPEKKKTIIQRFLDENFMILHESQVDMDKIYEIVGSFYKKDSIEDALNRINEIMFTDSYYYMLNYEKEKSNQLINSILGDKT